MDIQTLIQQITDITIWKKGEQRAPHKPLLLLYVLSQYKQGHKRLFHYETEIDAPLLDLLTRFGPQRAHYYPNMPSKEPTSKQLVSCQVYGGVDEQTYQYLKKYPLVIDQLAELILNRHFPESVQDNLINRLGFVAVDSDKHRDPKFRQMVLRAYNYQCAICGYDLRHDSISIGLEAAHVKWKQHGGPCIVNNGLALCSLHHSAFDMVAIGLDSRLKSKYQVVLMVIKWLKSCSGILRVKIFCYLV